MHVTVPAALLSLVYTAAIAVAVADPGRHALAGLVVLTGLLTRWAVRTRHRAPVATALAGTAAAVDAVLTTDAAAAPATAA